LKTIAGTITLLVASAAAAAGQSVQARLDAIFTPSETGRMPGLAVMVRQAGRTIYQRGWGVRDARSGAPIDATTNFRLASCTKQFTAAAIMLLVRDGKLTYDRKIGEIFPDLPAYARDITIGQLLTHTSGLPDYEDLMASYGARWSMVRQIQDDDVLELLKSQTHGKFAPGTSWSYSNSGYVLLGLVVAQVGRQRFESFLRSRIFAPLDMDRTIAFSRQRNSVANRAYGHVPRNGTLVERDQSATSATLGDGGVYSNLADLAKWDEGLRSHKLFSAAEMRPALDAARLTNGSPTLWPAGANEDNLDPGKPVAYGYGWFLNPFQGHPRMWHFGSTTGFATTIQRFPADDLTVIVLANRTDLNPRALAERAAETILGAR
jgi:CubicO group peptidase (beta-lactamase class C family)